VKTATAGLRIAKAGAATTGGSKSLEPLSRLGQLGRDTRFVGMDLRADMVRDQAHDPLAIGGGHRPAAILQTPRQPVYPKPAVGVEHHLDDRRVFEEAGDGGTERGAQHARAP
jgi:hypothetical protein